MTMKADAAGSRSATFSTDANVIIATTWGIARRLRVLRSELAFRAAVGMLYYFVKVAVSCNWLFRPQKRGNK